MTRDNIILVRMNDREKGMLDRLAAEYMITRSEVIRMITADRYRDVCDKER